MQIGDAVVPGPCQIGYKSEEEWRGVDEIVEGLRLMEIGDRGQTQGE